MNTDLLLSKLRLVKEAAASDWKWAVRFLLLILGFLACFLPLQARLAGKSQVLVQRQHEIELAKTSGVNLMTAAAWQQMQTRTAGFESGYILLSQVTQELDQISDAAHNHHLRVIRIHSDSPEPLKNEAGSEILVKGKKLFRLPIRIRLETNFRNLGEFLKALSKDAKEMFVFDEMTLERLPAGQAGTAGGGITISAVI